MDPNKLVGRVILGFFSRSMCVQRALSQSPVHNRANHKYERNSVLPVWRGARIQTWTRNKSTSDGRRRSDHPGDNTPLQSECDATLLHQNQASSETKAAMEKVERALTDIQVTPKQITASVTLEISVGDTSMPYISSR